MPDFVQRSRPWLGTLVEIRVGGLSTTSAIAAIEAAFIEIAAVHRCMSFQESTSDLSRLHAAKVGTPLELDTRTLAVLRCALDLSQLSDGCFDPTIAAQLVEQGMLPRPRSTFTPSIEASWQDIELLDGNRVRLLRPLWLDLSGIAKGYAVDRAVEILLGAGATQTLVNAGGDLRVAGSTEEIVHLRGAADGGIAGRVALSNAALASSSGVPTRVRSQGRWLGTHVHGRSKQSVATFSSASVIAPSCMIADALTKIVFSARPGTLQRMLSACGAQVARHSARHGWRYVGAAA